MAGVKFVNEEIFCDVCGNKVEDNHKYCSNCGNPLKLETAVVESNNRVDYIDRFLLQVYETSKQENISLESAMKKVRTQYE